MMREFHFYLDAWQYCVANLVEYDRIQRKDWKTWIVNEDE
jgi:hypothetical protein